MTLLAGIKCSDGVVLGADGAATFPEFWGSKPSDNPTEESSERLDPESSLGHQDQSGWVRGSQGYWSRSGTPMRSVQNPSPPKNMYKPTEVMPDIA